MHTNFDRTWLLLDLEDFNLHKNCHTIILNYNFFTIPRINFKHGHPPNPPLNITLQLLVIVIQRLVFLVLIDLLEPIQTHEEVKRKHRRIFPSPPQKPRLPQRPPNAAIFHTWYGWLAKTIRDKLANGSCSRSI